jgi:hypothetical protein
VLNILVQDLEDQTWMQCCLPVDEGGLGIGHMDDLKDAAYVSSVAVCLPMIQSHLSKMGRNITIQDLQQAADADLAEADADADCGDIPTMLQQFHYSCQRFREQFTISDIVLAALQGGKPTFQSKLSNILADIRKLDFKDRINDSTRYVAWMKSLECSEAGMWLSAIPKYHGNVLSNSEFRTSLCTRLFIEHSCIIRGSRCTCKNKPSLDPLGHHLMTGCNIEGCRTRTHDMLVLKINDMLRYCGQRTQLEEQRCFQGVDPDNNKRPDISIFNLPWHARKFLLDLQISNPIPGSSFGAENNRQLTAAQAAVQGRVAQKAFQGKMQIMQTVIQNDLGFLPIIFETAGYVHKDTITFFKKLAAHAEEEKKIPKAVLYRFMMTQFSVCQQRHQARAILQRSSSLNGRSSIQLSGHGFAYETVSTHDVIRSGIR